MPHLFWFKEDLRVNDNTALHYAARQEAGGIVALYLIDISMWKNHQTAGCKIDFILRGLGKLHDELEQLNIPLLIKNIANTADIPQVIFDTVKNVKATALFFNYQYEFNEARRDKAVVDFLAKQKIICHVYHDQVIFAPGTVLNKHQAPYKVFTAYKNAWLKKIGETEIKILSKPKIQAKLAIQSSILPKSLTEFSSSIDPAIWPAGEKIAKQYLAEFIDEKLFAYDKTRDFPAIEGTSKLSTYLNTGMISVRECFLAAFQANQTELYSGNKGAIVWMQELIWREYYKHLLVAVPRISMNKAYKKEFEHVNWQVNESHLLAWQMGQTGYPLIDAAMRQLHQLGWMHNRLRMIVAMFLSKNLLLNWRLGENYFMNNLIDGDLAANNGGWQWSASTGTDSAPYFRIFNPVRQSERFDPKGLFIRKYCPEIAHLNDKEIHFPYLRAASKMVGVDYPKPIVDSKASRTRAIAAFRQAKLDYQAIS